MFKLMNNSFYGKTYQNIRKYRDVKFLTNETRIKTCASQINCQEIVSVTDEIKAAFMKKVQITLNKPIYIGFSVLEISKTLIYDFHYNFIRKKYKDKARLLFTDTDSLCYEIETEDLYDDLLQELDRFDTSDYPKDHKLHSDVNKKVIGKMKDETNGVPIEEFVGLKPKMYSLKYDGSGKKCGFGVDTYFQGRKLSHDDYKKCLDNREESEIEQVKITYIGHQVHTVRERRAGLSPYDDKRYVRDDGIHTLAYGHKDIPVVQRA
ncbi:unnamed protein product [Lymnaea stagnalis]|uniref:DNA-directed DNA polymerase n=1 Tax=Lymnaea stagnalis TaxID=6523 RepID=A0AAV2HQQ2_LYMST